MHGNCEHSLIFDWGAFDQAPEHIAKLGKRPLLMTGKNSARRLGLLDPLLNGIRQQGGDPTLFEGIGAEPSTDVVNEFARLAKKQGCDVIVGLGGGSVLDVTKAVAAITKTGSDAWSLVTWGCSTPNTALPVRDALPLICIPTVTGSGSEANGTGVLYHPQIGEKAVFFDDALLPSLAIVDPQLTTTVGPEHTYAGALDIIAHGIEDHLTQSFPHRAQGLRCLNLANSALMMGAKAARDPHDREARTKLAALAIEVWDGSFNGPETPWTLHAIAHVLGARFHIGHSFAIAWLLPHWVAYVRQKRGKMFSEFYLDIDSSLLPLPVFDLPCMELVDELAQEIIGIYGINGTIPGWPELEQNDIAEFIGTALGQLRQ